MIMGLLVIVRATMVSIIAIVTRRVAHKAMLQRLVAFLVPLEVPYHILFLDENTLVAIMAVKVFPIENIEKQAQEMFQETNTRTAR